MIKQLNTIIIDGHSLIYRAYFATINQLEYQLQTNQKPTNALEMMLFMVSGLLKRKNYNYGLVAFDTSRKSFRTELFQNYKNNRKRMDDHLIAQIPLIINAIKLMGFKTIAIPNFEADDIIGTFAQICSKQKVNVDIYSSDNDMLQLVNEWTNVNILKKGISIIKEYNINNFAKQNAGLMPKQIIDLKCLCGDNSDNYKGIIGIGPKTALKLILEYKNVYNIYNNIDKIKPKTANKINAAKNDIDLFKKLATIVTDVNISKKLSDYTFSKFNKNEIENFLKKNEIKWMDKYF